MSFVRNIFMILFTGSGLSCIRRFILRKTGGPLVRIFTYHDVPEEKQEAFERQIQQLQHSCHIISPQEFERKEFHPTKVNLLLTFDDGYQNWVDVVLPVLEKFQISALFFVSSGFVDTAGNEKDSDAFTRERLLREPTLEPISWDEVVQLQQAGHTIGGHTRTHSFLCTDNVAQLSHEIGEDKKIIEQKIQKKIYHFAYPFGRIQDRSEVAAAMVAKAEYTFGYTIKFGFNTSKTDPRYLLRDALDPIEHPIIASMWAHGAYDWLKPLVGYRLWY